ncbi:MAG: hypothetical protein KDA85_17945, partial [Planctomycetaceae bacterium]|nr:hypothetical protein [Planctomycetaceae bacterium]
STVVDPSQYTPSGMGPRAGVEPSEREGVATMGMVARDSGDAYAPFRADAGTVPVPQKESGTAVADRPQLTPDQFWKRAANMLAKLNAALEPQLLSALDEQPDKVREKLAEAFRDIADKLDGKLD